MLIEQLAGWMEAASGDAKRDAALGLVKILEEGTASAEELEAAEAALTCLLDDPEPDTRKTLAEALSMLESPPRYLVLALANDEPEITIPLLARSRVLLDGELIRHLQSGTENQQVAIACRPQLSARLCAAIAENGCQQSCLAAVLNPGAKLEPLHFYRISMRFGDDTDMRTCLLARHDIGMAARILLIEKYAISLADCEEDEEIEPAALEKRKANLREICDKAVISFAAHIGDDEIAEVVDALIDAEKLTTSFLLRAICMGNITLFAQALATLSGQPVDRVSKILREERRNAFHAIYAKSGMPLTAMGVFQSAISAWKQALPETDEENQACLPYQVTRRVLAVYEGEQSAETDELLLLLRKICTEAARENARYKIARLSIAQQQMAALPAPDQDWGDEELMLFACYLADELAEMTLADEGEMAEIAENMVAANLDMREVEISLGDRDAIEAEIDAMADIMSEELQEAAACMQQSGEVKRASLLNFAA